MKINELFSDFEACSSEEWRDKIIADLKIDDPNKLAKKDENDISHYPFYTGSDTRTSNTHKAIQAAQNRDNQGWKYVEVLPYKTGDLEKSIKQSIDEGVDEVVVSGVESIHLLEKKFKKDLKEIGHLHIQLPRLAENKTPKVIFCDPIGEMLKVGKSDDTEMEALSELFQKRLNQLKPDNFLLVDGTIYKNTGASIIQEIALTLQHAVEYIDQLTDHGFTAEAIARSFTFKLAYSNSFFSEIAKTRAFRYLIQKIYHKYNVSARVRIWGEASSYYQAHSDIHTNLLRSTSQAISAILGNCDLISIPAYDSMNESSVFGRRMAKNISLILKNESYFDRVKDIAAGSYYIENLSIQFVEKAWELFLKYEGEKQGFYEQINTGGLKRKLEETHLQRVKNYTSMKKIMLGVNKYQNAEAKTLEVKTNFSNGISSRLLSKEIEE